MKNDVLPNVQNEATETAEYANHIANLLATKEGKYIDVSKSTESLFGYTVEEIKTNGRNKILLNDQAFQEALAERDKNGTVKAEITGVRKDGTHFPVLWYATIFKSQSGDELVNSVIIDLSEKKRFEKTARENAYNLDLILKNTEEAFLITNTDLKIVKFNEAYKKVFYFVYRLDVKVGDYLIDYISEDRKSFIKSALEKVLTGETYQFTKSYNQGDEERVFETTMNPLILDGEVIGIFAQIKDTTERFQLAQHLRTSNERFELASKASYDIIWDTDFTKKTIYLSEAIEANLGIEGPITITLDDFFKHILHPDDVQELNAAIAVFVKSKKQNAVLPDHRLIKSDGSFIHVKAKMHAVRNDEGQVTRMIGVITDVTSQKIYEQNLRTLNKELQRKTERLMQSNAELERFAYIASHDLQEPLRMVSSFLSLIHKRYNDQLDDTGRQYIQFAVDGAERMKRLILNLLDFSRLGQTPVQRGLINTNAFVKNIVDQFALTAKEKNAEILVLNLPDIVCVKSQIGQVFQNLISNALKYSNKNPVIKIDGVDEGDFWHFFITDNGIGINPKYFEKIFVVFQKLHTQNEYPGTGIGLAIVKKIIEHHGGKVWVDSEPDKGSTFHFTIEKSIPINEKTS